MEKVEVLEAVVKKATQDQHEALAEAISPPNNPLIWQKARATQSKENVLGDQSEEDQALKKSAPTLVAKDNWLSEVTGSTPLQEA
jgi:hypothetical protein